METEENSSTSTALEVPPLSTVDLKSFINNKFDGLINLLTDESELLLKSTPLILAFHNFTKLGIQLEPWCNQIAEVAKEFTGQVAFAVVDFKTLSIGRRWNKFNFELLGARSQPRFFAFDSNGNQFRKDEFFSRGSLKEFATLLLKGKLFVSEALPEDDVSSRVKDVVASNLKEIFNDCDKDIFIVFYAMKNRNSKELLSRLEELARLLQHEELKVFKMNAEENHIPPDFNIVSYPRCFYIRKDDKSRYIEYEREKFAIENLIEFIAVHSSKELECCDRNGILKERIRFKTELHLDSMVHIRTLVKNKHNDSFSVINRIEVTDRPLVVAFHQFRRFYDYLEPWCDIIEEVAIKFQGTVDFAIADINSFSIGGHKFKRETFTVNTCPWIFAFDKDQRQYGPTELSSLTSLATFIEKLLENQLPVSDLLSVHAMAPLLKVTTEEYFNEIVQDQRKDVFILFYVSWSCNKEFQINNQEYLASLLQDDDNQVVVIVDADAVKPPPFHKIGVFPTYVYITNSFIENRNYWRHDTAEELLKVIAKNSRYELKYYDREGYLRREYKRITWIKPLQSILTTVNGQSKNKEEENILCEYGVKHKLGNLISTAAFEGMLTLRDCDDVEDTEIFEDDVKVVICKNLREFVLNTHKDILLVFYEHLFNDVRLQLNELAKLLNCDEKSLVIAKMNTHSHPVLPEYKAIYYPKSIFIQKNDKNNFIKLSFKLPPARYGYFLTITRYPNLGHVRADCIPTVDEYIKFIAAHASVELTNYDRNGVLKKIPKTFEVRENNIFHLADAYNGPEYLNYERDIMHYIQNSKYEGLLGVLSPDQGYDIKMYKKPLIVLMQNFKKFKEKILIEWSATLLPVLKEFREKIHFYICDNEHFKELQFGWEFRPLDCPIVFSVDSSNRIYKGRHNENFMDFTSKTWRNEHFKSEPLPPAATDALVKKAVALNFEELVLRNKFDVFVLIFNSQWYGAEMAEKLLLPVAEFFKNEEIVFVHIDGSMNYIPLEFNLGGYFKPTGSNEKPIRFNNYRNFKSFVAFLSANTTNELKNYDRRGIRKKQTSVE